MIDILLPTYNGEKFLRPLVDSIIDQTIADWRIVTRDDGSTDGTVEILRDYKSKYGDKFVMVNDSLGNLGPSGNNDVLMHSTVSEYFMFCDQDDIWKPEKIEVSLEEMKKLEAVNPNIPILICSDACCIDENNKILCESFFENQKFIDTTDSLYKMLALNIVQGNTMLMNNKVREVVRSIPRDYLHDAWVACIIKYYGEVSYIHKPLLLYRQHTSNVLGAMDVRSRYFLGKLGHGLTLLKLYKKNFDKLPFPVSILKWGFFKALISMRRSL